jgi:hypothetical protein
MNLDSDGRLLRFLKRDSLRRAASRSFEFSMQIRKFVQAGHRSCHPLHWKSPTLRIGLVALSATIMTAVFAPAETVNVPGTPGTSGNPGTNGGLTGATSASVVTDFVLGDSNYSVPEPPAWGMIAVGGVALLGMMRRRKHQVASVATTPSQVFAILQEKKRTFTSECS